MRKLFKTVQLWPLHLGDTPKVLEVLGCQRHDKAALGLGYMRPNAAQQKWLFIPLEDGYYEIVNLQSKKVLDDSKRSFDPGGQVYQYHRHLGENQQWKVKMSKNGKGIVILSRIGGFALDVGHNRTDRHAAINLWHNEETDNQIWRVISA